MEKSKSIAVSPKKTAEKALRELKNPTVKTPEEVAEETSKELAKYGVKSKEKVEIVDPITHEKRVVTISRTGTQESDLILALADPNLSRDKKDFALSMYLWGRGAESASLIVDLMKYKGTHTKETRVFKSQMRFDFEALVESIVDHLQTQAQNTANILGVDLKEEITEYKKWLEKEKPNKTTFADFIMAEKGFSELNLSQRIEAALISQAIYQLDEAEKLTRARRNIALAREREKGGGIYVDKNGKVYDATMPEIDDIIKKDREATNEIENESGN